MFTLPALTAAVALLTPLMAAAAWCDLKWLRIPNLLVAGVFLVFLGTGIWGLPVEVFFWRLGYAVIALLIGFGIYTTGIMGAGDAKMIAALAPFVGGRDLVSLLVIYAGVTVVLLGLFVATTWLAGSRTTGWAAIDQRHKPMRERALPMGLIFAITILVHLGLTLGARLG